MTLIIESQKKPPCTRAIVSSDSFANGSRMRKEIKLSLPFFGRVCPAFIAEERGQCSAATSSNPVSSQALTPSSKPSVALTEVKQELDDSKN